MKLIYISGPYTRPDPVENTRIAIDAGVALYKAGYVPLIPHLSLLWQLVAPMTQQDWYNLDLHYLERCDLMLRLPGISLGADIEVDHAEKVGIPVFHGTAEQFLQSDCRVKGW